MPTLLEYYGISVTMNLKDKEHLPPHIHASYAEYQVSVEIETLNVVGDFPIPQKQRLLEWVKNNRKVLLEIWETQQFNLKNNLNTQ